MSFRLYTEAEQRRWWGPRHLELVIDELDLRVGGRYRFVHRAPTARSSPSGAPTSRSTARTGWSSRSCTRGKPEDEAIDTYTLEPVDEGTLVRLRKVHSSIAARDAHFESGAAPGLTAAHERQDELVVSLQKGASPVSKLILKMSLDGFVADASGDNAFIFSSMSEDATAWTMDTLGDTAAHLMGARTRWESYGRDPAMGRALVAATGPQSGR